MLSLSQQCGHLAYLHFQVSELGPLILQLGGFVLYLLSLILECGLRLIHKCAMGSHHVSQGFFQIHFSLRWLLASLKWWHTILVVSPAIILVVLIILVTSPTLALILILILVLVLICIPSILSLMLLILLIHILCLLYCHLPRLIIHSTVLSSTRLADLPRVILNRIHYTWLLL